MDNAWDVAENGQQDVDEEIRVTPGGEEHRQGGKENGDNDLDDL